ncbi:uncharacterized protein LOC34623099 [Cyclospora cayetanensis]|uniref:Uncharacterized protein LOC34623099 n=1 Tax=Cyclospora cayetanensis TaxID=88456 RepID=A0A6P6RXX5_9EIME|nr:uncharacterized protein LOC34623099 [Cyclospora cayetanensis]
MRSGTRGAFDSFKAPFVHGLQRGTTVIRCTHAQYYGEVEWRRHHMARGPGAALPGVAQQQMQASTVRRTAPGAKEPQALALTAVTIDSKPEASNEVEIPERMGWDSLKQEPCNCLPPEEDAGKEIYCTSEQVQEPNRHASSSSSAQDVVDSPRIQEYWARADQNLNHDSAGDTASTDCFRGALRQTSAGVAHGLYLDSSDGNLIHDSFNVAVYLVCRIHLHARIGNVRDLTLFAENCSQVDMTIVRGYIDIAHALLRHFEEALETKQRLTEGSLQCAETVCRALQALKDTNPRLEPLVERIMMATELLHKRKTADEKYAMQHGLPCVDTTDLACPPWAATAPLYVCIQNSANRRHEHHWSPRSINRLDQAGWELREVPCSQDHSAVHSPLRTRTQPKHSAGPPPLKAAPPNEMLPLAVTELQGTTVEPRYISRSSMETSDVGSTDGEMNAAMAVNRHKASANWCAMDGAVQEVPREGAGIVGLQPSAGTSASPTAQQIFHPQPPRTGCQVAPLRVLDCTRGTCETAVLLPAPELGLQPSQSTMGLPITHLVGPQAGGGGEGTCHSSRTQKASMPFRGTEQDMQFRPRVLSETRLLTDTDSSQKLEDASTSIAEALSFIKYCTDFILSREGLEYVEKKVFRYSKAKEAGRVAARPTIPEGMTSAQGKYILLHHAIEMVEDEYGDSPAAEDPHLYLPDLRRMADIVVGTVSSEQSNERNQDLTKGKDSQRSHSGHSLPERFPEQRMERHLPLSIFNLPATGHRLEGREGRASGQGYLTVQQPEASPIDSGVESWQPVTLPQTHLAESATGSAPTAQRSSDIRLLKPLSSASRTLLSSQPFLGKENMERSSMMGYSQSSRLPRGRTSSIPSPLQGLSDLSSVSDTQDDEAPHSTSPSPLPPPSSISSRAPSPSDALPQPSALSGLLHKRKDDFLGSADSLLAGEAGSASSAVLRKPAGYGSGVAKAAGIKGSRAEVGASLNLLDPAAMEQDALKLSIRSVVRDSTSGAVASRVFRPPENNTGQAHLDLPTAQGLRSIIASRTVSPELPKEPPGKVMGSVRLSDPD